MRQQLDTTLASLAFARCESPKMNTIGHSRLGRQTVAITGGSLGQLQACRHTGILGCLGSPGDERPRKSLCS